MYMYTQHTGKPVYKLIQISSIFILYLTQIKIFIVHSYMYMYVHNPDSIHIRMWINRIQIN